MLYHERRTYQMTIPNWSKSKKVKTNEAKY